MAARTEVDTAFVLVVFYCGFEVVLCITRKQFFCNLLLGSIQVRDLAGSSLESLSVSKSSSTRGI